MKKLLLITNKCACRGRCSVNSKRQSDTKLKTWKTLSRIHDGQIPAMKKAIKQFYLFIAGLITHFKYTTRRSRLVDRLLVKAEKWTV